MPTLENKVVLLTGASKGIGAATARTLGAARAHLVAHYGSDRAGAEEAAADIPAARRLLVQADLAAPAAVDALWREAVAWRGRIDVLVNNAAVFFNRGGIEDDDETWDAVWEETLKVNVLGPARLIRHAVRHFQGKTPSGGVIVTVSSWSAQRGSTSPRTIAYAASKAAIRAATQTVARGYAREGILAYVVAPGVVRTRMSVANAELVGGEAAVSAGLAMGEWVPPEEVADLVAFLATGRVRHLSGATLDVNGASYVR